MLRRPQTSLNFPGDVPARLAQVFNRVRFQIRAPEVLHGVAQAEVHVLRDLDALHPARVRGVVLGVVDLIAH